MDFPVIIVGGGPVGLACSLFLSRFEIPHLLIERHPGTSRHPKAMGLQTRTMEIFRGLGVAGELTSRSLPEDWTKSTFWCKSLFGEILREIPLYSADHEKLAALSPMHGLHCPQTATEEVLLAQARKFAFADIRFSHEMVSFDSSGDRVSLQVLDRSNEEVSTFDSQFLIAADGSHGTTRAKLNIERLGPPDMGHFANIHFRANIGDRMSDRKGIIYNCLSEEDYGSVVAINGTDEWLTHHYLMPGETMEMYSAEYCRQLVSRIAGIEEKEITILGISPWVMSAQISKEFRSGRVFLTGDAAHRTTPAGGLGLNTGIHSAHNLCWKLGAFLRGWCDESILDTYHEERQPIVASNIESSKSRVGQLFPLIEAACSGRWEEAVAMIKQLPGAHSDIQRDLGYRYTSGAFAKSPSPSDSSDVATPAVGARAPHRWRPDGASILDLFGQAFVYIANGTKLLEFGEKLKNTACDGAMQVVEGQEYDQTRAVLVRPDGFVGWLSEDVDGTESAEYVLESLKIKMR